MLALEFYVFDMLSANAILAMPFLQYCNPLIDWVAHTVSFGHSHVLALPQHKAAQIEVYSLQFLVKTIHKAHATAQFYLLQSRASCLTMGVSKQPQVGQKGPASPPAPGADHPQVPPLLTECYDVFGEPVVPPESRVTHDINLLDPDAQPPPPKQYQLSPVEQAEVRHQLGSYLAKGWVHLSSPLYGASVLFACKKDGTLCICVDLCMLNMQTSQNVYPLPCIKDLLDHLFVECYFSKINLVTGYHQVRITPEHQHRSIFLTSYGLFKQMVMPFGLVNAPSTFQRLMNQVFFDVLDQQVVVYLNNIFVYSSSLQEHLYHLCSILTCLCTHQLYVKIKKCAFFQSEGDYLGHIVGHEQVHMDPAKLAAICEWPIPTCV